MAARIWTEEQKIEHSSKMKGREGRKWTQEQKDEMSLTKKKNWTLELRLVHSEFMKGNTYTLGQKHSEETKKKYQNHIKVKKAISGGEETVLICTLLNFTSYVLSSWSEMPINVRNAGCLKKI